MTPAHINPGTDTTKEYICNDEDLGCLYDYMMAAMAGNDISELPRLWNQEIGVIKSRTYTLPHPTEAQKRIDAAIKELGKARRAGTFEDIDGHIDEAIALLQAGRK